jgi:hypothetical protein
VTPILRSGASANCKSAQPGNRSLATSWHDRNDGGAPRAGFAARSHHERIGEELAVNTNSFNTRYNASNSYPSLGEMNTIPLRFVSENQAEYPIATMCRFPGQKHGFPLAEQKNGS